MNLPVLMLVASHTMMAAALLPTAAVADECERRVQAVKATLSAVRQAQLQGAGDAEPPAVEFEPALRTCFRDAVVPKLKASEGDDEKIQPAWEAALGWFRQAQLLGYSDEDFADEWKVVHSSLTTAFRNGYTKAKARCRTRADVEAAKKLRTLFVRSAIVPGGGAELFPAFETDVAKCLRGRSYLITVTDRTVAEKIGTVGEMRYLAVAAPTRDDPEEMEGDGSYSGYAVSTPNCDAQTGKWHGQFHRLPAAGRLSAWAQTSDMSFAGGPASAIGVILGTLDWPYKPMFFNRRDAVATGEDREGVAGSGTFARTDIPLTDPVTTQSYTETSEGGFCAGTITSTTTIRIVRLGG